MPMTKRDLIPAEIDAFLKDNQWGSLTFAGGDPYAIPVGYMYKKGDVLLGLTSTGRKMDYLKGSHKICYMICRPRWQTPDLKESCTSVIMEGELEEVADRVYYGLSPEPANAGGVLYRIRASRIGTRKCTTTPCEILAAKAKESEKI
jgi:hypothetical protein